MDVGAGEKNNSLRNNILYLGGCQGEWLRECAETGPDGDAWVDWEGWVGERLRLINPFQ